MKNTTHISPKLIQFGIGTLLMILLIGSSALLMSAFRVPGVVYIHNQKVFESFKLTTELDAKLTKTFEARKSVLENLDLKIQAMKTAEKTDSDSLIWLQETFMQKQQEFTEDQTQQQQNYNKRIWTQINQYAQEFRDAHRYDVVLGADGSGRIMAADPDKDVTDTFIEFINQKYEGK